MSFYTSRQSDLETSCKEEFAELPVTVLIGAVFFVVFLDFLRNIHVFSLRLVVSHYAPQSHWLLSK